ncbi:hypothetical protein Pecwa_0494 [Pectobacterium parmentieri WPP163]|nr:hypothetical protein Pecwa_0494 [Pectobacterium parmentieri WPP163]
MKVLREVNGADGENREVEEEDGPYSNGCGLPGHLGCSSMLSPYRRVAK